MDVFEYPFPYGSPLPLIALSMLAPEGYFIIGLLGIEAFPPVPFLNT